jgi:ribonuclease BN (tRNA processing enzyme)
MLTCLGVGDGWPCADRRHSSFLYQFGRSQFLVDCGDGASSAFKSLSPEYDRLDRIFLSHLHADHIGGFHMFMQGLWLEGRRCPLPVSLPREGLHPLQQLFSSAYLFPEMLGFPLHFEALRAGRSVRVGGVRVTPHPTRHLERMRQEHQGRHRRAFECFSFVLEGAGRRVAHTADIGHVDDLIPLTAKPLDLLVCELAHCEATEIFAALRGKPIRRIVFIHLARQYWADKAETRRLARQHLGGIPFLLATDGCEIRF